MNLNSQNFGLRVASVVFGVMTAAQLARLVMHPEVIVAGHHFPLWPSALAVVVLGSLSVWLWKLARSRRDESARNSAA